MIAFEDTLVFFPVWFSIIIAWLKVKNHSHSSNLHATRVAKLCGVGVWMSCAPLSAFLNVGFW